METIFMTTGNSKTKEPHKFVLHSNVLHFTCCSSKFIYLHVGKHKRKVQKQKTKINSFNVE